MCLDIAYQWVINSSLDQSIKVSPHVEVSAVDGTIFFFLFFLSFSSSSPDLVRGLGSLTSST